MMKMGQTEVLELLEKYEGQWFTAKQIQKLTRCSTVDTSLRILRRHSEIKYKLNPNRKRLEFLYSLK